MNIISAISWNNTPFYFDNYHRAFIQGDNADLSSENYHCAESDLEWANEVATQDGLTDVLLEEIDPETFTIK